MVKLGSQERRLIPLRLWRDQPWETIAKNFDLASADAARMRYNRALDRLRELMPAE